MIPAKRRFSNQMLKFHFRALIILFQVEEKLAAILVVLQNIMCPSQ